MTSLTDLGALVRGLAALRGADLPRLLAVGWATVDLERTLADIGTPGVSNTLDEPLLGARAVRLDAGGTTILVLEPATEGRLASALARRGEGICALYLTPTDAPATQEAPGDAVRKTALGLPGRLMPHDQPWGPFVIEVRTG